VPTTRFSGFVLTDHVVEVPLDNAAPDDGARSRCSGARWTPSSTIHTDGARELRRLADMATAITAPLGASPRTDLPSCAAST
jgi:hypothetical protein